MAETLRPVGGNPQVISPAQTRRAEELREQERQDAGSEPAVRVEISEEARELARQARLDELARADEKKQEQADEESVRKNERLAIEEEKRSENRRGQRILITV